MLRTADGTRWIFALYLLLLIWAPLPLGSNRPWSRSLLVLWILFLAMAWLWQRRSDGVLQLSKLKQAWPILICSAAWIAFVWMQLLPLPAALLNVLSPEAARLQAASVHPETLHWGSISLDYYSTLESACRSTAFIAFLFLTLILLQDRDRVRLATYTMILSGIFQAIYGIIICLQSNGVPAVGTFVNRNHYSAYLVMCLSISIGALVSNLSDNGSLSWRQFARKTVEWIISPKMALRLLILSMVIALVLTRSRMGNSSFFLSLLAAGLMGLLLSKRATKSMVVLLVSLIIIDVLIVGTYFGTRQVIDSIAHTTMESDDRDELATYAIQMWKDYPVLGSGLGSFPLVFPRYSGQGTSAAYTHAHNDYLELGTEVGVLGLAILGMMVVLSFVAALRAQYMQADPLFRGTSFSAMMGITALMLHSFVDFNLQIPANAMTFMFIIALAWLSLFHIEPA